MAAVAGFSLKVKVGSGGGPPVVWEDRGGKGRHGKARHVARVLILISQPRLSVLCPSGAAVEHFGGEAGLQAGQGEGSRGVTSGAAGVASGGQQPGPRLGAGLSPRPVSRPQPPIQVYGLEGRYATALYSAASKQKKLEQVEKELIRVWVRDSTACVR